MKRLLGRLAWTALLLSPSPLLAKDLGRTTLVEQDAALVYERDTAGGRTVFFQPKLSVTWTQIAADEDKVLWSVVASFRTDVDLDAARAANPAWNGKPILRDEITAARNCAFTPDLPQRLKSRLKHETAGKTFAGLELCRFDVLTRPGDTELWNELQAKTQNGTLIDFGLEVISYRKTVPTLVVDAAEVHAVLAPYKAALNGVDRATAVFASLFAVGQVKGAGVFAEVGTIVPQVSDKLVATFYDAKAGGKFVLKDAVESEPFALGERDETSVVEL